jgi:hypothetical protein
MLLSFKPEHIVNKEVSNERLMFALKEAFDLRLRRHDEPKTGELKELLLQVVPIEEIRSMGTEHLPFILDCYAAWIILEYLRRQNKIKLFHLNLQHMFDFEYLDKIVREHEDEYVGIVKKVRVCEY